MFDISDYLQALVSISGTHPKLFAIGLVLIAAYVVPKILALATASKFPQFSAGCNAICMDVVKAMKIFVSAVVGLRGAVKILAFAILCSSVQACSVSLEKAREDGIAKRAQMAPPAKVATRDECDTLDKTQRYFGYAGYATGPAGVLASGIAAVPGVTGKSQDAFLITAGIMGAITVFEFAEQGNFEGQWVQQGCGQ
jgi:hypothetical protein